MKEMFPAGTRETRRYKEKREAILDSGARLFNQRGLKGATLADIAQSVGLATNSVTYYYRKKEDLAASCLLASIDAINNIVSTAGREVEPAARIRRLFELYLQLLQSIECDQHSELALFNDIRALTGKQMQTCFDAYTQMFRNFRDLVRPQDGGRFDRVHENSRTHLLLSIFVTVKQLARRYNWEEYGRIGQRLADMLVDGVFSAGARWPDVAEPISDAARDDQISTESFLRAATLLINEQGYRGASVDKISARINVTKGSFYHHNDNKDDVVSACFSRSFAIVRQAQNEAEKRFATGSERLAAISASLAINQLAGHGPLLRTSAWSALPNEVRYDVLRDMNQQTQRFASIISDGQRDGTLKLVDPLITAHATSIMINAVAEIERWVSHISIENVIHLYVQPFFCGLLSRNQSA